MESTKLPTTVDSLMYINGEWTGARSGQRSSVTDPATGEVIAHVPLAGREETRAAVEAAHEAFRTWSRTPAEERAQYLRKIYQLIVDNTDELARIMTLEQGKPFPEARGEVAWGAEFMLWYAEEARRVYGEIIPPPKETQRILVQRQPVGVVAAITPWNFPSSMITRKLAPALAAGCTAVVKPAPETPLSAIALFDLFEQAGLPKGVVNLVTGEAKEIGREFLENPLVRKISFTGSTAVGKYLLEQSAQQVKKVSLELGGHAPYIVFNDADLELAVEGLIVNKFQNGGQTCICGNRIFVQETVQEEFLRLFTARLQQLKVGNGFDDGVAMGPLIHRQALEKVYGHVQDALDKGATLVCGGTRLTDGPYGKGHYYAPTVLTGVNDEMKIFHEETFGPVAPIITFRTEEEAIRMANNSPYGLAAYFYTKDLARTMRVSEQLEYGMIGINESVLGYVQAPFGGVKQSGNGREGGRHGIEDFLELKYLNLNF